MSDTNAQKKDKAVLDTFQLFYEELPVTAQAEQKRKPRLQRRSKKQ